MDAPAQNPIPPEQAPSAVSEVIQTVPDTIVYERSSLGKVLLLAGLAVVAVILLGARSEAFQKVWEILTGHQLPAQGKPVAASTPKLSEHVRQWIESQPPQVQAEELLSAAINHDEGATDVIMQKLDSWYGRIRLTPKLADLEMTALYSNDLRVRAAAIEVTLVANELQKTPETTSRLIRLGEETASNRPWAAWYLGMLANRGVDTDEIHERLVAWSHDPDEQTRFWAVEGLAHVGTDNTIATFLDVFRSDPSDNVRERAGCSLAKSGMLTRAQRMQAVPGLIDLSADESLDASTHGWVFQALREITDENLPNDTTQWRLWYSQHGSERLNQFQQANQQYVLGNS
jgi:hypothetical protein